MYLKIFRGYVAIICALHSYIHSEVEVRSQPSHPYNHHSNVVQVVRYTALIKYLPPAYTDTGPQLNHYLTGSIDVPPTFEE